jgi:hypothetical protein
MKPNLVNKVLFILFIAFFGKSQRIKAQQNDSLAFAAADTTNFSVNTSGGWRLFNSFLAEYDTDSVQAEIILQHDNTINLNQEQLIGRIKTVGFQPQIEQNLSFTLLTDLYSMRIDREGSCYLRFISGDLPDGSVIVVPIKVLYRRD